MIGKSIYLPGALTGFARPATAQFFPTAGARRPALKTTLAFVVWLLAASATAAAQTPAPVTSGTPSSVPLYFSPSQISAVLRQQFISLGTRLQTPGNERITMTGSLTDSTGTSSVQVAIQNGGNLNITWVGTSSAALTFNGATAAGVSAEASQDGLLESFVDDLPDTLMASVAQGMGLRMLGQGFRDSSGGTCDIYDVPTLGQTNKRTAPIAKRYCFNSQTFLLEYVRYISNSVVTETQFSWQQVNGQAVPAGVLRVRNGTQLFSFQAQSATTSAAAVGANIF
jgi:hypothetical protein